jgi:hypothetical protein
MPTVRPATALAVLLVLASCASACGSRSGSGSGSGSGSDKASTEPPSDKAFTEPPPCNPEGGQPISEATLKAVLARNGIRLYRDDRCLHFRGPNAPPPDPNAIPRNPNAPQATLSNTRDSLEYDRIVSEEGHILCEVERGHRYNFIPRLERIKYEGDEETELRALNVSCAIYPESPEQIDALAAALLQLPGVRPERAEDERDTFTPGS